MKCALYAEQERLICTMYFTDLIRKYLRKQGACSHFAETVITKCITTAESWTESSKKRLREYIS